MQYWLAECDKAKNWYAGTLKMYPITSLLSQARKTRNPKACREWCDKNPGFTPKRIEMDDDELANVET